MRLPPARLLIPSLCVVLPAAALVAAGVVFLVRGIPRIERDESDRLASLTENAAHALRDAPETADFTWRRGKGIVAGDMSRAADFPADMLWKDWRPESGARSRSMWGWRQEEEGRLVWARVPLPAGDDASAADDAVVARLFPIAGSGVVRLLRFAVPVFLFAFAAMTLFGLRYFIGYVKSRDDFLAAAAHDLTTPLVAMRNLIGRDDREASLLTERLLRLVANIKDFLKLGGKRPAPAIAPFDLVAACREAYSLFRDDYRDLFDGKDVEIKAEGEAPIIALGDATLAVQIAWNILGNDLKYAAPYGNVKISVFRRDGFAVVEFADAGPGMSPREMRRAFDRYYRAKTVLESGKGGFGIGLCAARDAALDMGGSLTLRPNSPRGCVFTLSLPLA